MKAIVNQKYGPPDVLELQEIKKPTVSVGKDVKPFTKGDQVFGFSMIAIGKIGGGAHAE